MASAFGHAAVALIGGKIFADKKMPARFWWLAVLCAVLPDFDAAGFALGIPYESFWGHRGFTHSIVFAIAVGFAVVALFFRKEEDAARTRLIIFFALVTLSHGLLDMLTSGGHGVALFAPFDNARLFFPWRPIAVSPISISAFFSSWGLRVLASELLWIGVPMLALLGVVLIARRRSREQGTGNGELGKD